MAGPSIAVRVLGDVTALAKSFQDFGSKARGAASAAQRGFGSMLSNLNRSGVLGPFGAQLETINGAVGDILTNGKKIGPMMIGVGGAVTAVGATLSAFGSKEQASHKQLQAAIAATGHSYENYSKNIESAVKHGENLAFTSKDTQDALSKLTVATNDPAKALRFLGETMDVARFKHIDLASAATQVGKVYNGNTKLLKEFGITATKTASYTKLLASASKASQTADTNLATAKKKLVDLETIDGAKKKLTVSDALHLRDAEDRVRAAALLSVAAHQKLIAAHTHAGDAAKNQTRIMTELAQKTKGQASAAVDTFAGRMDILKTKVEDSISQFGQKYGPALQGAGIAIMAFGTLAQTAGAMSAAGEGLALGPILLIVVAIAALIVAAYLLWRNWSTIWGWIKGAAQAVWDWIAKNWPLIVAILVGPIGVAVLLILKNWQRIKDGAAILLGWLRSAWDAVVGFFSSVASRIGAIFAGLWNGVTSAASSVVSAVQGIWNGFVGWLGGLPGRIASIATGMFHGITEAFRSAINALIDIWNRLHFQTPTFSILGHSTPSLTIGVPPIPHLAQGGLLTSDGLVYAHAGEVISPAPARGPAVHVEHAHFAETIDVEAFLRKAASVMERQRV
jgi:hypothetical protein